MPVAGVGGLIGQLRFPGLDDRLARDITPNPNPLAQQGGPAQPGQVDSTGHPSPPTPPPGSNLAPPASTQADPYVSSLAKDMIDATRRDAMAQGVNSGMDSIAAGFGTAQQQASKQAAIRGGQGVGSSLADLNDIQAIQGKVISDNEHARFMGNAHIFGETLRGQGINVTDEQATEIMNGGKGMTEQFTGAAAGNATTPDKLKEADAESKAWAAANPGATPQEIAQHKSDYLSQVAGGLSGIGKSLAEDRRNWMRGHPGATFADMIADKPELADETSYVAIKTETAKASALAGQEKQLAKESFAQADQSHKQLEDTVEWLNDPKNRDAVQQAINMPREVTGGYGAAAIGWLHSIGVPGTDIPEGVKQARIKLDYLKNQQYAESFTGTKNLRSNTEANKLGATASSIDNINNDRAAVDQQLESMKKRIYRERANLAAAAGKVVPYKYRGLADNSYLDKKSNLYQGGSEEEPATITSPEDIARLPSGRAFTIPSGPHKGEVGFAP